MKLHYIGPLCVGLEHPGAAAVGDDHPPSCYLVEVSAEAGIEGEVIEGDVLVVDEARHLQHADLVVVAVDSELRLFRGHRIGRWFRLTPAAGGRGQNVERDQLRGVVVRHKRMKAA